MTTRDLTTGPIPRHLVALALPVIAATTLQSVYALVNLAWVGLLGETNVAGLAISLQVFFIVLAVSQVLGTTALSDISHAWGAGRRDEAGGLLSAYVATGAVVGAISAVLALACAAPYVDLLTDDPGVARAGVAYLTVSSLTFFTQVLMIVVGQALRAAGDFTTPVRVLSLTIVLNAVIDPFLMFGGAGWPPGPLAGVGASLAALVGLGDWPGLGIAGAAWATTIAQTVAIGWYAVILLRARTGLRPRRPAFSRALLSTVLVRGLPAGLQFLLLSAVLGVVLAAMKPYGPAWTAAAGGGFRIVQQGILPIVAVATAAAAMAGQNAGAGRFDRVRTVAVTALAGAGVYALVVVAIFVLGAPYVGRLFAARDALGPATVYLTWTAPALVGFAASLVPTFVLQALRYPVLPMLAACARIVVLAVVALGVVPALGAGPAWVFGTFSAACWLEGLLDLLLLARILALRRS